MHPDRTVAFVTGAASGIGRAAALELGRAGMALALVDRDADGLARTVALLHARGIDAIPLPADVAVPDRARAAVDAAVARFGRLDAAVNAAGVEGATVALVDEDDALFDRTMDVNVRGTWACMKAQIARMIGQDGGGAIVNVASAAGLVGSARSAVYSASKHAVIGLTRSAALQYARRGVRVNAVCPAGVATPMAERIAASSGGALASGGGANYPVGRYATPEEVASAIAWLCSPGAASTTGTVLAVDGGFTAA